MQIKADIGWYTQLFSELKSVKNIIFYTNKRILDIFVNVTYSPTPYPHSSGHLQLHISEFCQVSPVTYVLWRRLFVTAWQHGYYD